MPSADRDAEPCDRDKDILFEALFSDVSGRLLSTPSRVYWVASTCPSAKSADEPDTAALTLTCFEDVFREFLRVFRASLEYGSRDVEATAFPELGL